MAPRRLRSTTAARYLEREDPSVERQTHPGQLVPHHRGRGGGGGGPALPARHRRQRDLEQARLLQQLLAPEPGPPHRVGARERAPPARRGRGAEDLGGAVEEVEDVLDGGHAGEGAGAVAAAAVAVAGGAAAAADALAHGRLGCGASCRCQHALQEAPARDPPKSGWPPSPNPAGRGTERSSRSNADAGGQEEKRGSTLVCIRCGSRASLSIAPSTPRGDGGSRSGGRRNAGTASDTGRDERRRHGRVERGAPRVAESRRVGSGQPPGWVP